MDCSLGRLTAHLADPGPRPQDELIELINDNINPPRLLTEQDVHIRAMHVVSDEVNSFGGRFAPDEHNVLAALLIDSPVLVGHRKDRLPIARTFHAENIMIEGRPWVKSYFYWLSQAAGAETLRENLDGGVYKECSVGFTYRLPECSVCGQDIRTCEHQPLADYEIDGEAHCCHFNYRQIDRVLETSLVYRGAVPNTAVVKASESNPNRRWGDPWRGAERVSDLDALTGSERHLVIPKYEGLPVEAVCREGLVKLRALSGEALPAGLAARFESPGWPDGQPLIGQILALRGRERLGLDQVRRLAEGESGNATRLELRLLPTNGVDLSGLNCGDERRPVRVMRHALVSHEQLAEAALRLATRDGVRIWSGDRLPPEAKGLVYRPVTPGIGEYRLDLCPGRNDARLSMSVDGTQGGWCIRQFNLSRLKRGARFVADPVGDDVTASVNGPGQPLEGAVLESRGSDDSLAVCLSGPLAGAYAMQAITIEGRPRFLFYRLCGDQEGMVRRQEQESVSKNHQSHKPGVASGKS